MPAQPLSFLLNNEQVSIDKLNPNTTILKYLRENLARVGTKEGCASGDCGACTVVVGEVINNELRYRSVNSCTTLLINLHGKQLITVEDLQQHNDLHSVQQSMVDCHGSQCGFCTPGFVMSLFALQKKHNSPTRPQVLEALSGNLCRCTGYRSIIEAGLTSPLKQDSFDQLAAQTIDQLLALQNDHMATLSQYDTYAFYPKKIEQLAALVEQYPGAKLLAGGTDLALEITQNLVEFDVLISTLGVRELSRVTESNQSITIGAGASYSDFKELLANYYPSWGEMIDRLGSLQVRNLGTLGGNIANASPIGDMPPVLIALDAKIRVRHGKTTRDISAEDFFLDYKVTALREGEFIESVTIAKLKDQQILKIYKVSKRFEDDISAVLAVIKVQLENEKVSQSSIAYGGMAATPKRASNCENTLTNQPWNEASIAKAAQALEKDFNPISDVRASSGYRLQVAKNLLRRAYAEVSSPETATQVNYHA